MEDAIHRMRYDSLATWAIDDYDTQSAQTLRNENFVSSDGSVHPELMVVTASSETASLGEA